MPSLRSLVVAHRTVLLIDSASACVQVGLWRLGSAAVWRQSDREAGVAFFECADAVLTEAGTRVVGDMVPTAEEAAARVLGRLWSADEQERASALLQRTRS